MSTTPRLARPASETTARRGLTLLSTLGLLFGIVMPVVAGLLFPTYVNSMPVMWQERARILELQFVACELAVIAAAFRGGFSLRRFSRDLPMDIRVAAGILAAAMIGASAFKATNPADAMLQTNIQLIHCVFAAAVYFLARRWPDRDWPRLTFWLTAGVPVIALYTAWRFLLPPPLAEIPGGQIQWDFAVPGFISVRYLGIWLGAIGAALSVKQLFLDRNERLGASHLVLLLVLAFMFWTGTRAAVLGVLVAIAASVLVARRLPAIRALMMGAGVAVTAYILAQLLAFDSQIFVLVDDTSGDVRSFMSGRLELWLAALGRIEQAPVSGWGTGSLLWDVYLNWHHTQPHNSLLQFAMDWGLFGAAAAVWIFGRALWTAQARAAGDAAAWPILALVNALLAMSMVDGALYYPRFVTLVLLGLALLIAVRDSESQPDLPST